jgi:S-adenosylmethionine decarboxylase
MFFEGTEKKIELIIRGANFRAKPESFWRGMVEASNAKILSKISNDFCDSYLLSESSLFVWDERMTMITCGTTTLVNAASYFFDHVSPESLDFLTYERKNEYFPHRQPTDFLKDVELLQQRVPGKVYRFGSPDEHHMFLYHLDKHFKPQGVDCTLEVLMHDLEGEVAEIFNCNQTIGRVRELARLEKIFPDFQIDDFLFEPCGYSLNAIRGPEYYTIHVTPEEGNSYVSFETNVRLGNRLTTAIRSVLEVFRPRAFDVIYFHSEREMKSFDLPPFQQRSHYHESLNCGFEVGFSHYSKPVVEKQKAVPIER